MTSVCTSLFLGCLTRASHIQRETTLCSLAFSSFRRRETQHSKPNTLCSGHRRLFSQSASSLGKHMTVDEAVSILSGKNGGSVDLDRDKSNGLAVVTLNNPTKRNALTGTMMLELDNVVSELEQWENGRYVILKGSKGYFCSGADLNTVRETLKSKKSGLVFPTIMHPVMARFSRLPMISVALIEGGALGGGAELTTWCDFRIATASARVAFLHVKLGVVPGFGGGTGLTNIVGRKTALDLFASAKAISMTDAEQIGFVDHIIPDGSPVQSLASVAEWLTTRYPHGSEATRDSKTLVLSASSSFSESLEIEKELFGRLWGSPAHLKALGFDDVK